jgi:hypothetical protein
LPSSQDTPERWQRFAQSASAAGARAAAAAAAAATAAHVDAARLVLEVKLLGIGLTLVMDKAASAAPVAGAAAAAATAMTGERKVAREEILHVALEAIGLSVMLDAMDVKVELSVHHFQVPRSTIADRATEPRRPCHMG